MMANVGSINGKAVVVVTVTLVGAVVLWYATQAPGPTVSTTVDGRVSGRHRSRMDGRARGQADGWSRGQGAAWASQGTKSKMGDGGTGDVNIYGKKQLPRKGKFQSTKNFDKDMTYKPQGDANLPRKEYSNKPSSSKEKSSTQNQSLSKNAYKKNSLSYNDGDQNSINHNLVKSQNKLVGDAASEGKSKSQNSFSQNNLVGSNFRKQNTVNSASLNTEKTEKVKKPEEKFVPIVGPKKVSLSLNTKKPIFITHSLFLSLGMDSNLIRLNWQGFDFNSKRLLALAKSLSPAVVRMMGTDGDKMTFDPNCDRHVKHKPYHYDFRNKSMPVFIKDKFTFSCRDWDQFNIFCGKAGWSILFGINVLTRTNGRWDSTNFQQILDYSIKKKYHKNLHFELGNEPEAFPRWSRERVSAAALAEDYKTLRQLLRSEKYKQYFSGAVIGGPGAGFYDGVYLKKFLNNVGGAIDAVTWHQYYGGSRYSIKNLENATDPKIMNNLYRQITNITQSVRGSAVSKRNIPIWLAETSTTSTPYGNNLYESYAMGFMMLDKLGLSAKMGMQLVVRQTFYGFWFALVDLGIWPTPGYWIALLFKNLVGREVLNLQVTEPKAVNHVRFYAHCTNTDRVHYPKGSVTLYGMNLYDTPVNISIAQQFPGAVVEEYLLTPYGIYWGLVSKYVALNGQQLVMQGDNLPVMPARPIQPGTPITMPGKSYGFYVIKDAKVAACMTK